MRLSSVMSGGGAAAVAAVLALSLLVPLRTTDAHPLAPAVLEVHERADGRLEIAWKTARLAAMGAAYGPVLPERCRPVTPVAVERDDLALHHRWTVDCGPQSLIGERLGVTGLATAGVPTLVRVVLADGRVVRGIVSAGRPWLTMPARPRPRDVLRDYGDLGVHHILGGTDHLLFVLGLLLLARTPRLLAGTITAFTAGHSVTLSLAALGIARVPSGPIEVAIALSVLALAIELARAPASTLMRRHPWTMSLAFGLLHGLGFAAALRDAGLPPADVPLALLAFNVGIETGQLLVVAAALAVKRALLAARATALPHWAVRAPVYVMGSLAAFWCFERTAALVR